jgi:hypothetical protein
MEEELIKSKEIMDFVVGKLVNANMKFTLLKRLFESYDLENIYLTRADIEALQEGFAIVNGALEKVSANNSYTDKDMYMLMKKYKE